MNDLYEKVTDYCICRDVGCPLFIVNLDNGRNICPSLETGECKYQTIHHLSENNMRILIPEGDMSGSEILESKRIGLRKFFLDSD